MTAVSCVKAKPNFELSCMPRSCDVSKDHIRHKNVTLVHNTAKFIVTNRQTLTSCNVSEWKSDAMNSYCLDGRLNNYSGVNQVHTAI